MYSSNGRANEDFVWQSPVVAKSIAEPRRTGPKPCYTVIPVDEILSDLFSYVRFASVSGDSRYKSEVNACADWLTTRFERAGLKAKKYPTAGHPIVVARSRPQKDDLRRRPGLRIFDSARLRTQVAVPE